MKHPPPRMRPVPTLGERLEDAIPLVIPISAFVLMALGWALT